MSTLRYDPNINTLAHFHRFFLSFQAQKLGYLSGCRPLIGIDGTHIKKPYQEVLLLVVTLDDNNGVYPLALGVVDI